MTGLRVGSTCCCCLICCYLFYLCVNCLFAVRTIWVAFVLANFCTCCACPLLLFFNVLLLCFPMFSYAHTTSAKDFGALLLTARLQLTEPLNACACACSSWHCPVFSQGCSKRTFTFQMKAKVKVCQNKPLACLPATLPDPNACAQQKLSLCLSLTLSLKSFK